MSEDSKLVPPYVAFEPLGTFIGQLNKTVVPAVIDKGMMSSMSGATRSHLMSAMRSLELLDSNDAATQELRDLVAAYGTEAWPNELKGVVETYYSGIMGDVDITTASSKQVRDKFKEAGVEGSMADRAIRFFIKAMEEAKMTFSPHIKMRKKGIRKVNRTPKPPSDQSKPSTNPPAVGGGVAGDHAGQFTVPDSMISQKLYFRRDSAVVEGLIVFPKDVTAQDCNIIMAQLEVIRIFANVPPQPCNIGEFE